MATTKTKTTTAPKAKSKTTAVKTVEGTEIDVEASVDKEEKQVDPNMIKKKDIYDHVSVSTGLRKRDVREAVDSLLEYMHKCLEDGKTIQVPPLGKIKSVERGSGDNVKTHYKLTLKKTVDAEKKAG